MRASSFSSLLASLLLTSLPAQAAPSKPAPRKGRSQISIEEVAVMLSSSDEDEVRTALETAATLPPREVLDVLEERVRGGLSRELLDVAIDSLLLLGDPSEATLLLDLARHRRPEVRVRALEVIGRLKLPHAEATLTRALSDSAPEVRKAAADALAQGGAHGSMSALYKALELGVDGAGHALGRLAKPDDLARLLTLVNQLPMTRITPMIEALLARKDVTEAEKLRAIGTVVAVGGEDATAGVSALLAQLPSDAPPRVRRALTDAVQKGNSE
jgi:hypothetical protein